MIGWPMRRVHAHCVRPVCGTSRRRVRSVSNASTDQCVSEARRAQGQQCGTADGRCRAGSRHRSRPGRRARSPRPARCRPFPPRAARTDERVLAAHRHQARPRSGRRYPCRAGAPPAGRWRAGTSAPPLTPRSPACRDPCPAPTAGPRACSRRRNGRQHERWGAFDGRESKVGSWLERNASGSQHACCAVFFRSQLCIATVQKIGSP